jgi:hypothetical protein
MSLKSVSALVSAILIMLGAPLYAQDGPQEPAAAEEKTENKAFKLLRDSSTAADELALEAEAQAAWVPAIKAGTVEVGFAFGFLDLNTVLWEHKQIIYKYNTDSTFWGDVKIKGESAFNPVLRLGYNLTKWLSLEGIGGLSISEYTSTIENRFSRENKPDAGVSPNPPLGEFDAERRSLLTIQASANAVIYPLNISGDGEGRMHPYITGGVGNMWYDMNSNYTDQAASTMDYNFGGGLRILADRNISVRFEVLLHVNTVEFTPGEWFTSLNEGTTLVPINEYPVTTVEGAFEERQVTKYSSQSLSLLNWSIGVQGSF